MFKLVRRARKNQKGFTLVELMVVVVIIGILTAIAVPVYNNVTTKAEQAAVEANLRTIDGAIMMYYASNPSATALTDVDGLAPDFLGAAPTGPGTAEYGIVGTAPQQRATVTAADPGVGGKTITTATKLEDLAW